MGSNNRDKKIINVTTFHPNTFPAPSHMATEHARCAEEIADHQDSEDIFYQIFIRYLIKLQSNGCVSNTIPAA